MEGADCLSMFTHVQAKQDTAALQEKSKELKASVLRTEEEAKAADAARDKAIMPIGNLVHDSVPISDDEARLPFRCSLHQHACFEDVGPVAASGS